MRTESTTGEATSDWSLLARIRQKEEEALAALYDRYSGLVFSEAKRILQDTGAAEEILQHLFYQVWQTAGRFDRTKGSLAGWLLVAARSRAISKLRQVGETNEGLDENGVELNVDLESHEAQNLLADKVRAVMARMPEGQREVLKCAYFEGTPYTEIAEKTRQPLETVKTRIRSAMESLKKALS